MDGQDVNCFHAFLGYTPLQAACDTTQPDAAGQLNLVKILIQSKVLLLRGCGIVGHYSPATVLCVHLLHVLVWCVLAPPHPSPHLCSFCLIFFGGGSGRYGPCATPAPAIHLCNTHLTSPAQQASVNATRGKCGGGTPDMNTALHLAAMAGVTAVIGILVQHGAKKLLLNLHGQIPLDLAIMHRKHDAAQLLRDIPELCGLCYLIKVGAALCIEYTQLQFDPIHKNTLHVYIYGYLGRLVSCRDGCIRFDPLYYLYRLGRVLVEAELYAINNLSLSKYIVTRKEIICLGIYVFE